VECQRDLEELRKIVLIHFKNTIKN
jgi:hypothetical protein